MRAMSGGDCEWDLSDQFRNKILHSMFWLVIVRHSTPLPNRQAEKQQSVGYMDWMKCTAPAAPCPREHTHSFQSEAGDLRLEARVSIMSWLFLKLKLVACLGRFLIHIRHIRCLNRSLQVLHLRRPPGFVNKGQLSTSSWW